MGAYATRFARRLRAAAETSSQFTTAQINGLPFAEPKFDAYQTAIGTWAQNQAATRIVSIADTTREKIRKIFADGVEAGDGNAAIAKRIRNEIGGKGGNDRAMRIARTETHTATQVGAAAAAAASRVKDLVKEWGATEDERTRPEHAAADGQVVALTGVFIVGGEKLRFPGDPNGSARNIIQCRCVSLYRMRRPSDKVPAPKTGPVIQALPVLPPPPPPPFQAKPEAERKWHEAYFDEAPARLKEIIRKTPPVAGIHDSTANSYFSPLENAIYMRPGMPHGEAGEVWRHEFGHAIDFAHGNISDALAGVVAADRGAAPKSVAQEDEVVKIARKIFFELMELPPDSRREVVEKMLANTPMTLHQIERVADLQLSEKSGAWAAAVLKTASSLNPAYYLQNLYMLPFKDDERKTLMLHAIDYINAVTASIGFGHSADYYAKFSQLGNGVTRGHVKEAFANHVGIAGSAPELSGVYSALVKRFAPATWAKAEKVLVNLA